MSTVRIIRVIENADFRGYKKMYLRFRGRIRPGEAIIVFNKRKDRARLFDSAGGIYYAPQPPPGEEFNIKVIASMLHKGLFVDLTYLQRERKGKAA